MDHIELIPLFFLIAVIYSSAGFGGGSSYLALLTFFELNFHILRSTSLLCNIMVVSATSLFYIYLNFISFKKVAPLIVTSIPAAYLGGWIPLRESSFFLLLAATLLGAAILMWFKKDRQESTALVSGYQEIILSGLVGALIGFLSGMVGIGGGIFLAPILYLLQWDSPQRIAATCSLFILINSMAGLAGQMSQPAFQLDWSFAVPLMIAVLIGGQIGQRLGVFRLHQVWIKRITSLLIFAVGIRILLQQL